LGIGDFAGSQAPVLIVDLGMPRVVDGDVDTLLHVRRLDIAHLSQVIDQSLAERREEITAAEAILRAEVEKYLEDRRSRGAASIVAELRERFEDIRRVELAKRQSEFSFMTAEQWEMVESLTRSIVAKIAHQPTLGLKDSAGTDRGQRLTEALRNLFDL
jgi:glutamyl-tRNA reductase